MGHTFLAAQWTCIQGRIFCGSHHGTGLAPPPSEPPAGDNREKEKMAKSVRAIFFWEKGRKHGKSEFFYRMRWIFCEGEATRPTQVINFPS